MMDNLNRTDEKQLPLLKSLLGQHTTTTTKTMTTKMMMTNEIVDNRVEVTITRAAIDTIVDDLVLVHHLNVDQHDVLLRCSNWFKAIDDPPTISNEILLIHGIFGSGKVSYNFIFFKILI